MNEIIAYCGLSCHECGAYIATENNDDKKRQEVATLWSKEFNTSLKSQDINCLGCLTTSEIVFSHCKVCEIRKCGVEKKVTNCAYCDEYICEKLDQFFKMALEGKKALDEIREKI